MASTSSLLMRYLTVSTTLGFATPSRYIRHTPVLVLRPTVNCSTFNWPLRILRRMRDVLVRRFSVKPSRGPRTTDSDCGSVTDRFSQPFELTTSPPLQPSTSNTVSPERQPSARSGIEAAFFTSEAHSTSCCSSSRMLASSRGRGSSAGQFFRGRRIALVSVGLSTNPSMNISAPDKQLSGPKRSGCIFKSWESLNKVFSSCRFLSRFLSILTLGLTVAASAVSSLRLE